MRIIISAVLALALAGVAQAQTIQPLTRPAPSAPTPAAPWTQLREMGPAPRPDDTGTIRVGDAEIYYASYGKGRPVVLLHGGLANGDYWASQVGPLSQNYQVIVPDLRGHGRSTRGTRPFTYALLAGDVLQVIQKLHLNRPAVVGWGDGGVVALELAMKHPGRVGELVVFGGNYAVDGLKPGVDQTQTFVEYVHKTAADYQALSKTPGEFDALFRALEAMWAREPAYSAAQLGEIETPTTVVVAEHDEWVRREHSEEMARLIPDAQLVVLPAVSHFAPWQAPKKFNDVVKLLLATQDAPPKKKGLLELMRERD